MSLESAQFIHQLNSANPSGADRLKDGDDHIRMLKAVLKATFPGFTGPLDPSVTNSFLNALVGTAIPVGTIALFSGATAPDGWGICDGSTYVRKDGTGSIVSPDMRDRVPVGSSSGHALGSTFGAVQRTATSSAAGAHTHAVTVPAHSHSLAGATATTNAVGSGVSLTQHAQTSYAGGGSQTAVHDATLVDATHSHTVTVSGNTAASAEAAGTTGPAADHQHAVTVDVTQPSLALNFIIKL